MYKLIVVKKERERQGQTHSQINSHRQSEKEEQREKKEKREDAWDGVEKLVSV